MAARAPNSRFCTEANAIVEVRVAAEHGSSLDSVAALSVDVLRLDTVQENAKLYHDA